MIKNMLERKEEGKRAVGGKGITKRKHILERKEIFQEGIWMDWKDLQRIYKRK